ncbi:hypothetical protein NHX12_006259, partial [Muraenolepis orangiensis]
MAEMISPGPGDEDEQVTNEELTELLVEAEGGLLTPSRLRPSSLNQPGHFTGVRRSQRIQDASGADTNHPASQPCLDTRLARVYGPSNGRCVFPTFIPEERAAIKVEPRQADPEVLNRQRSGSPQLLRCVKRTHLDRVDFEFPHKQTQFVASVARRNERERNRVRQVNDGFQTLRQHVPSGAANGKLSKVETLRSAVEYIRALQRLLKSSHSMSSAFENTEVPSSPSLSSGLSVGPESPHSTCSSSASEDGTVYGSLRSEEPELVDFSAWLHRNGLCPPVTLGPVGGRKARDGPGSLW